MGDDESAEQAAVSRRERLKALKAAKELLSTPDNDVNKEPESFVSPVPVVAGRETVIVEKDLSTQVAESDKDDVEDKDEQEKEENEKLNVKFRNYLPHDKQLQEHKLTPPVLPKFEDPVADTPAVPEINEDPFLNIAPKKPNWDLRRDVQKRLDKLERRTMKAIYQLYEQQEKQNLALEGAID
ncbi:Coiled-coil domain containing 12 [Zostera marina]|uniref:Coiled-coil domain containing 12 n=1 Tax=Zostera marina TaxID=29655 RepID=A0A0K9P0T8_ZOSMR|nr:Coiled-coil domain containing 12 [Zostera marina]